MALQIIEKLGSKLSTLLTPRLQPGEVFCETSARPVSKFTVHQDGKIKCGGIQENPICDGCARVAEPTRVEEERVTHIRSRQAEHRAVASIIRALD